MSKINVINENEALQILNAALSTGADFAEIFMEDTTHDHQQMTKGKVNNVSTSIERGASIRITKGATTASANTNNLSFEVLLNLAKKVASNFEGEQVLFVKEFTDNSNEKVVKINEERIWESGLKLMEDATKGAFDYSKEVVQVVSNLVRDNQHIKVYASDGTFATDHRIHNRLSVNVAASDGVNMESSSNSYGKSMAMDMYDGFDAYKMGQETAATAVRTLHAEEMVGGEIPVVIHNGFGGVILHEACVHSLEATSVAKGMSVFCGKLGTKVASDIVNAVDTGIDEGAWGSMNVDDEGTPTRRNVLIENGILKSYLVDKRNSKIMNHPITSSSRRQNYKLLPTSRMTNTYFLPGTNTLEEIIANTKYGLFASKLGGGSVQPATGEFNFAVNEGYLIEDGKITRPVKGATLVGSGKDVLLRIDMIADNLDFGFGMCGSQSGSIPTIVGQPTIRVSHMTVGGKGTK